MITPDLFDEKDFINDFVISVILWKEQYVGDRDPQPLTFLPSQPVLVRCQLVTESRIEPPTLCNKTLVQVGSSTLSP